MTLLWRLFVRLAGPLADQLAVQTRSDPSSSHTRKSCSKMTSHRQRKRSRRSESATTSIVYCLLPLSASIQQASQVGLHIFFSNPSPNGESNPPYSGEYSSVVTTDGFLKCQLEETVADWFAEISSSAVTRSSGWFCLDEEESEDEWPPLPPFLFL